MKKIEIKTYMKYIFLRKFVYHTMFFICMKYEEVFFHRVKSSRVAKIDVVYIKLYLQNKSNQTNSLRYLFSSFNCFPVFICHFYLGIFMKAFVL